MDAISLEDMLAQISGEPSRPESPLPLPEAQIETLQEAIAAHLTPCSFKPGDLVKLKPWAPVAGHVCKDRPLMVMETVADNAEPHINLTSDSTDRTFREKPNVRCLMFADGTAIVTFWFEHYMLEPYTVGDEPAAA